MNGRGFGVRGYDKGQRLVRMIRQGSGPVVTWRRARPLLAVCARAPPDRAGSM